MSSLKVHLHGHCLSYIGQRIVTAQKAIEEAQASANDETKSSAGDKYETGRAMMQLEIEKNSTQLAEALKLKQVLDQIDPQKTSTTIRSGSVVITDQDNFYISISAGKIEADGKLYFSISPASPIGAAMMGLKADDTFQWNKKLYRILNVL